jgi:hypothetical protein
MVLLEDGEGSWEGNLEYGWEEWHLVVRKRNIWLSGGVISGCLGGSCRF